MDGSGRRDPGYLGRKGSRGLLLALSLRYRSLQNISKLGVSNAKNVLIILPDVR